MPRFETRINNSMTEITDHKKNTNRSTQSVTSSEFKALSKEEREMWLLTELVFEYSKLKNNSPLKLKDIKNYKKAIDTRFTSQLNLLIAELVADLLITPKEANILDVNALDYYRVLNGYHKLFKKTNMLALLWNNFKRLT